MKIYCIKDNIKGKYDNVYLELNDALALRTITNWINDSRYGLLNTNTTDFSVYCLGELDIETGLITSKVEFIINCVDLRNVGA